MRIAVLNDVHGNLPAFEAALAHAREHGPDLMVIAGDLVIGAPDSATCIELALSLNCPIIRGNHERYVLDYKTERAHPTWLEERFAPMHEAHEQLTQKLLEKIARFETRLDLPQAPGVLFVHGSARSDVDSVKLCTSEEELAQMFSGCQQRLIVRGHNHIGQVRVWDQGRMIVTSGSVGMALDGHPTAQYLLLDQTASGWRFTHQSAEYDLGEVLGRYRDTHYVAKAGPMGRLFMREVMTASHQVVPFLKAWKVWQESGERLSLGQGVERFLNAF